MSYRKDHTGYKQGKLTFISYSHTKNTHAYWNIKCKCGNIFKGDASRIIRQNTTSCMACKSIKHNYSKHVLYPRVSMMLKRSNEFDKELDSIKKIIDFVTKNSDYETFIKHKYTLARIDRKKPYSKQNLCWKEPRKSTRYLSKIIPIVEGKICTV